jgi:hypothetical protein
MSDQIKIGTMLTKGTKKKEADILTTRLLTALTTLATPVYICIYLQPKEQKNKSRDLLTHDGHTVSSSTASTAEIS